MSRIERLTPEQEARFGEFRDRWIGIGLSTDPADRPRAEAAIHAMYTAGGLHPPKKIVWCGSPLSQGLTRAIILDRKLTASVWASVWDSVRASVWASVRDSVGDSVGDSVRDSVGDSVGASVGDSVRDSVWASVRDSVWDSVRASVRASVWASVRDSVRDSVGASVWASVRDGVRDSVWDSVGGSVGGSVRDSVWDSVGDSVYGAHEANWIAFYAYMRVVLGLTTQTDKLSGLTELAQSAGWALPHTNICWVSERHNLLMRDERGRLHSVGGPAVAYPDGWKIYAVHGVRVPESVIEHPESITVQSIETEQNAEIRRVMMDQYGLARYITDSGAELVNQGKRGKLWRKEQARDEPLVMVEVVNSTPEPDGTRKTYFLRVPPNVKTASEAVAWTFGIEKTRDYRPGVET